MKKIFLTLAAAVLAISGACAQDVNEATDLYNNGASALSTGDNASALKYFQKAYEIAVACGEAGVDIANDCAGVIPQISLRVAKDFLKEGDFDNAVTQLKAAAKTAADLKDEDAALEANAMIPQVYMQKGNTALKAKDVKTAIAAYNDVLAINPENGKAALNLGQAYELSGDVASAEKAYATAAANGQEKNANKKLATLYLKKAQASLKAQKYADAVALSVKSAGFNESANAYYIAGIASQKAEKLADAVNYFEKYLVLAPSANNSEDVRKVVASLKQTLGK